VLYGKQVKNAIILQGNSVGSQFNNMLGFPKKCCQIKIYC